MVDLSIDPAAGERTPGTDVDEQALILAHQVYKALSAASDAVKYVTGVYGGHEGLDPADVCRKAGELLEENAGFVCGLWNGAVAWLIATRTNEDMLEWIARTPGAMETVKAIE